VKAASGPRTVLVCFAVKEEARPFQQITAARPSVRSLVVGMGKANAQRAIEQALAGARPGLVLTCGFAGGLDPELSAGTVVFDADSESGLEAGLLALGAKRARFHCSARVAVTAAEKQALRQATGADAVEMESEPIRAACQARGIPSATVRVILDTAREDLPLDFNRLMGPGQQMSYRKLALALLASPLKVGALLRLQKESRKAAGRMAEVLEQLTGP
jgi:adenosylhomocysteine nucleosidase